MSQTYGSTWQTLANPFLNATDTSEVITSHVSGRSTDITKIITGGQSAIIMAGAPSIGKSTLIRYLQRSSQAEWSWRNELADLRDQFKLDEMHFVQIDLTPLEEITNVDQLLVPFVEQCALALQQAYSKEGQPVITDLKGLRELLRQISRENPDARYFVMLDTIEHLERRGMRSFDLATGAQTLQERGIALLDHCGAIRTLVDLIDEFNNFGVLLSLESLPRPKIVDQFTHVSADLARFTTMTLQAFTWEETTRFLSQNAESFEANWANTFKGFGENCVFSKAEQEWLRRQAGTHPYLLQHFCFHTFHFKQEYANMLGTWTELQENDQRLLLEWINERLSTFLTHFWKRLQEALEKSSPETRNNFNEFISSLTQKQADEEIESATWDELGPELRYILSSEGIVRYDPFRPIHYPGAILCQYLMQKVAENNPTGRGFWVNISRSGKQRERFSLSELEYRLLKTLMQHPKRSTEEELMKGAWGKIIEKPAFTQRMYYLRKKLRDRCEGTEIIENHYGGGYSLNYPEWFQLE